MDQGDYGGVWIKKMGSNTNLKSESTLTEGMIIKDKRAKEAKEWILVWRLENRNDDGTKLWDGETWERKGCGGK